MITACITLELKKGNMTARRSTHVDFSQPSAIGMETQVNVSHQLRGLLPDLVNKRTNTKNATNRERLFITIT